MKGQARDLCLVPGALIASTTEGWIYCFRPGEGRPSGAEPAPAPGNPPAGDEAAARALSAGGVSEGYALAAGEVSAEFLSGLAGGSKLTVIAAAPEEKADALRKTLHAGGLYGTRVAVHGIPAGALPYADYFADLVVFDGRAPSAFDRVTAAELARVLRPGGGVGVILFPEALSEKARAWISSARLPGIESRDIPGGIRIRRGTLEGAGEWTHQYADPGKSCASADARVRLPLKALWFGGLGPAPVVSRHFRTPAPLVVDGRCFVPGTDRLVAMDIYNGRILWERDLPDLAHWPAAYRGPSLAADRGAVYALQKMSCLRLDPRTGETRGTYPAPPDAGDPEAIWDYLAVTDRLIVGAVGRPNIKHEWWSKAYPASRLLFALEKEGGKPRWTFRAEDAIDSDAIAIEGGRVFLIDGLARYPAAKGRKPRESRAPRRLVALDLETGRVAWKTGEVVPTQNSLWAAEGVVVATVHPYSRAMEDPVVAKAGGGVCAYDARDGKPLWKLEPVDTCSPVLVGGVLYLPHAYDLRIGKPVEVPDPLGGGPVHFVPSFPRTCSSLSGSPNLLMSRSGSLGFYDLRQRSGTYHYPIVRASCWINMIPAGGLVVVPEGSSSCVCGYNYKTSLALMPADRHFHFGIGRRGRAAETTSLRINFGAPGDRPDAEGRLWYAWPRPTAFGRPLAKAEYGPKVGGIRLPVEEAPGRDTPGVFSRNPDWAGVSGTERPWLYSCGLEGPAKLVFRLPGGTKPRRVDLHFCDLEGKAARVFDVRLQDHVVLDDFCIQRESGRAGKAVDRTFSVPSGETLTLELIPAGGDVPPPLLSGISIGDPGEK